MRLENLCVCACLFGVIYLAYLCGSRFIGG